MTSCNWSVCDPAYRHHPNEPDRLHHNQPGNTCQAKSCTCELVSMPHCPFILCLTCGAIEKRNLIKSQIILLEMWFLKIYHFGYRNKLVSVFSMLSYYRPLPGFLPVTLSSPALVAYTEAGWWSGTNRSIIPTLLGGDYTWLSFVGLSNKFYVL